MVILLCRTTSRDYIILDTEKVVKTKITEFRESSIYKVEFYTNEREVTPVSVTLKSKDEVEALITIWKNEGLYLIEDGQLALPQGRDLFKRGDE